MANNDGGPAFPVSRTHFDIKDGYPDVRIETIDTGVSVRDWFAGMALQGLLLHHDGRLATKLSETLSATAYAIADTMLKARD